MLIQLVCPLNRNRSPCQSGEFLKGFLDGVPEAVWESLGRDPLPIPSREKVGSAASKFLILFNESDAYFYFLPSDAAKCGLGNRNSVCHTRVLCDKTKQCTADILTPHERAITLVFGHQQWLVGDVSSIGILHSKWPTPSKNADFEISVYNVSTVRDSETSFIMTNRKSTTGFPTTYTDRVCSAYVTPKSPKGGSKCDFFVLTKIQFQSNKVCYKVSLRENFQRQHCSTTIPPSDGLEIGLSGPNITLQPKI